MRTEYVTLACVFVGIAAITPTSEGEFTPATSQPSPGRANLKVKGKMHFEIRLARSYLDTDGTWRANFIRCDDKGRLRFCYKGKKGEIMLSKPAIERLRKSARAFLDDPPPFVQFRRHMRSALTPSIFLVSVGDQVRVSIVDSNFIDMQFYTLSSDILTAAKSVKMKPSQRSLLMSANETMLPGKVPSKGSLKSLNNAKRIQLFRMSNGTPEELATMLIARPERELEKSEVIRSLGYLVRFLNKPGLGALIYRTYKRHPKEDPDLSGEIIYASLSTGCNDAMPEVIPLMKKTTLGVIGGYGLRSLILNIIDEETLDRVIKTKDLTESNAPRVWAWLLRHRNRLHMPKGKNQYILMERETTTKPTPNVRTDDAAKVQESIAADRRTHKKLALIMPRVEFQQMAFGDAIENMALVGDVKIRVRWEALDAAGICKTTPVSVFMIRVKMAGALRGIMKRASRGRGVLLDYIVINGTVEISTDADFVTRYNSCSR